MLSESAFSVAMSDNNFIHFLRSEGLMDMDCSKLTSKPSMTIYQVFIMYLVHVVVAVTMVTILLYKV